jgi:hypothetical protein
MATENQGTQEEKETTDWQTMVRCYNRTLDGGFEPRSMTIPESDFCISIPQIPEGPKGRPIDANLAVKLISDFYIAVKNAHGNKTDQEIGVMEAPELRVAYLAAREFLKKFQSLDYGVTIDKNFALKVLSQPKCEGLRGYLCMKDGEIAPFSLITVGVDQYGFDLKYDTPKTVEYQANNTDPDIVVPSIAGAPPVKNVQMKSLIGEYVTPPFTLVDKTPEQLSRYVLLNIATGQKDLLTKSI